MTHGARAEPQNPENTHKKKLSALLYLNQEPLIFFHKSPSSSYPLHPHRTAAGGRDFKRRRNAEERHAGAGVPREARGRRVGRKELRWARKEKKKEDKERKKGEGRGGWGFDALDFDFCLSTSIPVLTTSTYVVAWPQGDQFLGGGM